MPYEIVIKQSKEIESLLAHFECEGKGIYEKALSSSMNFSSSFLDKIRHIAETRNYIIHSDDSELDSEMLTLFRQNAYEVRAHLEKLILDRENQGKSGQLTVCSSCGKPTVTQEVELDKATIYECCVLCAHPINTIVRDVDVKKPIILSTLIKIIRFILISVLVIVSMFVIEVAIAISGLVPIESYDAMPIRLLWWVEYVQ